MNLLETYELFAFSTRLLSNVKYDSAVLKICKI